jgi:hypothetical protein
LSIKKDYFAPKPLKAQSKPQKANQVRAVNLDLPVWMLNILYQRADSLGISRKAMVNVLLGKILSSQKGSNLDFSDKLDLPGLNELLTPEWSSRADEEAFHDL